MTCGTQQESQIAVVKFGGSVLSHRAAYRRCAGYLAGMLDEIPRIRIVAVVSAEFGMTDELNEIAQRITPDPDQSTLDLLWSTGELRSVAILTLCLQALGINAVALNAHQCGLIASDMRPGIRPVSLNRKPLRKALDRYPVVVVPGFFATGPGHRVVSLGRGGSDLSAVLLASGFSADRCELMKDVPGYFTCDPRVHPNALPLAELSYDEALDMAERGCDLVQAAAVQAAKCANTRLTVRSLDRNAPHTIVSAMNAPLASSVVVAPSAATIGILTAQEELT